MSFRSMHGNQVPLEGVTGICVEVPTPPDLARRPPMICRRQFQDSRPASLLFSNGVTLRSTGSLYAADAPVLDDDFGAGGQAADFLGDGGVLGGIALAELVVQLDQLLAAMPAAPQLSHA